MNLAHAFFSRMLRAPRLPSKELQLWRDEMLSAILSLALVLGLLTAIPSLLLAVRDQMYSIVVVDCIAILWLCALNYLRQLSFNFRVWNFIFIVYGIGLFFFFKVGPVSQIFFMAAPIMTSLLVGLRPAIAMLALNAVTVLVVGYSYDIHVQFDRFHDTPFLRWLVIAINFTFVNSIVTITCGVLLRRLEESLERQFEISKSLTTERSSLRRANEDLRLISAAVENLNDIVMITDTEFGGTGPHLVFVNRAFERATGYSQSETIGRNPDMLNGEKTDALETSRIRQAMQCQQSICCEVINYTKSGQEFWLEVDVQPLINAVGECTHFVAVGRDITDRKRAEFDIFRLAFYDVLTGLPNRRLLRERMTLMLDSARRHAHCSAVFFIDLDHFKTINDARGHAVGDALLIEVARRLTAALRDSDTVARIGGDEFVVLVDKLPAHTDDAVNMALDIAENIRLALSLDFEIENQFYPSSCSIGVTILPKAAQTVDDLLRESDTAMYKAKTTGRNQIAFFEGEMQAAVEKRLTLERDLVKAMESREFSLAMQAQVNTAGETVGAELLLRWHSADRGEVLPSDFIPIAEESNLIVQIGNWVLSEACILSKHLREHGFDFPLSINVSPKQFRQNDFCHRVKDILASHGVQGEHLIFEVTEGLFIGDVSSTIVKMENLRALGIRFSIDDFGTGYSSLNYLKRLPIFELKIDASFVRDVPEDSNDTAIVKSILSVAKQFGLKVVAEGVETHEQAHFLTDCGCDALQGFLYCYPQPLETWFKEKEFVGTNLEMALESEAEGRG